MNSPYTSSSPGYGAHSNDSNPFPPPDTLPPPWIQQFDPTYSAPFYVNTETNESSWTHPFERDEYRSMDFSEPSPAAASAAVSSGYGGTTRGVTNDFSYSSASTPGGGGQAASFYGSGNGPASSSSQQTYYPSQQGPIPDDAAGGEVGPNGERGMGKVIAGGMALYMAKKMFDKWQSGKKQHQQPYYSGGLGQQPPNAYGGGGKPPSMMSSLFGGGSHGKPSCGAPPGYGPPGYYSRDVNQQEPPPSSPAPPGPYYGDGTGATPYGQNDYSGYQQQQQQQQPGQPYYGQSPAPPHDGPSAGWGDPRY